MGAKGGPGIFNECTLNQDSHEKKTMQMLKFCTGGAIESGTNTEEAGGCETPPQEPAEFYASYSAQEKKVHTAVRGYGSNNNEIHDLFLRV